MPVYELRVSLWTQIPVTIGNAMGFYWVALILNRNVSLQNCDLVAHKKGRKEQPLKMCLGHIRETLTWGRSWDGD